MNVTWVLANNTILDPTVDLDQLRQFGTFWGGWPTWRAYATDNVICHDLTKARELIDRKFHERCNLYVPNSAYVMLDRPAGIKLYEGEIPLEVDNQDELVALNLAATVSDVVLMLGFDWPVQDKNTDRLLEHRAHNYRGIVNRLIQERSTTQWIMIDPINSVRPELTKFTNFGIDNLPNVLKLLAS